MSCPSLTLIGFLSKTDKLLSYFPIRGFDQYAISCLRRELGATSETTSYISLPSDFTDTLYCGETFPGYFSNPLEKGTGPGTISFFLVVSLGSVDSNCCNLDDRWDDLSGSPSRVSR
jgi:hypothetical protein